MKAEHVSGCFLVFPNKKPDSTSFRGQLGQHIISYFTEKSARNPSAHSAWPSDTQYRRFHDRCLRKMHHKRRILALLSQSTAVSETHPLEGTPQNRTTAFWFSIRCRPFIGHTPRKFPAFLPQPPASSHIKLVYSIIIFRFLQGFFNGKM